MTTLFLDETPDSDGRISPRHVFETKVRICPQRDGPSLVLQGWTRNLSETGLNAFVAQALALGESVTLEIPLSDSLQHVIPAKVVRALGTEYGFQFTALSAEQRMQIRATLNGRPAIPYHGS
jgi:hypothetical protein